MTELEKFITLLRAGALPQHVKARAIRRRKRADRLDKIREVALKRAVGAARGGVDGDDREVGEG